MDSKELKKRRLKSGISQAELAKRLQVGPVQISLWESGKVKINNMRRFSTLVAMADVDGIKEVWTEFFK